jgi:hypothetical protein
LNKIITDNGYTWESNFFNTNFAKRLIIPNNQDRLTTVKTQAFNASITNAYSLNVTNIPIQNPIGLAFTASQFNGTGESIQYQYTGTTANLLSNIQIQGQIQLSGTIGISGFYNGYISFFKNGSEIIASRQSYQFTAFFSSLFPKAYRNISYNYSNTFSYTSSDTIELKFTRTTYTFGIRSNLLCNGSQSFINISSAIPIVLPAELNDLITINDTLPINIKQKDFFSSILKMFYLMVTEDKMKDRHFIIEPWVDFYDNNRTTYLDWSDKIQRDEPIRIKPMAELNARYYQLNYKSDNDWKNEEYRKLYNEGYGDRIYDNGFEFAKETDKTEVIFSATTLLGYTISNVAVDKIVSAIYKRNNGLEQQVASNIRILQAKKLTGYSSWYIQNRTPSSTTNLSSVLTTYGYAGHFDNPDAPNSDLNFGALKELYYELAAGALSNNLFNAYYSSYMAEITDKDSRVITVKMRLTESDIYNLDFGRYILIDQVLYRLSKVIDYVPGELCKVQLLRVISTNYQ